MKYNNILGLLGGIGLIVLTINNDALIGRIISFAGLIISIRFLIKLFSTSNNLLERILPNKNRINILDKKTVYYLSTATMFLGLILMIIEILKFEKVLRPGDFWKTYFSLGLVIALIVIYSLPIISSDLYLTSKRRFSITWGLLIGLPLINLSIASMTNRIWSSDKLWSEKFIVVDRDAIKKRKSNKLHYQLTIPLGDKKSKDLVVDESFYNRISIGDSIIVVMKNGMLGYEIIEEIKTNTNKSYKQ